MNYLEQMQEYERSVREIYFESDSAIKNYEFQVKEHKRNGRTANASYVETQINSLKQNKKAYEKLAGNLKRIKMLCEEIQGETKHEVSSSDYRAIIGLVKNMHLDFILSDLEKEKHGKEKSEFDKIKPLFENFRTVIDGAKFFGGATVGLYGSFRSIEGSDDLVPVVIGDGVLNKGLGDRVVESGLYRQQCKQEMLHGDITRGGFDEYGKYFPRILQSTRVNDNAVVEVTKFGQISELYSTSVNEEQHLMTASPEYRKYVRLLKSLEYIKGNLASVDEKYGDTFGKFDKGTIETWFTQVSSVMSTVIELAQAKAEYDKLSALMDVLNDNFKVSKDASKIAPEFPETMYNKIVKQRKKVSENITRLQVKHDKEVQDLHIPVDTIDRVRESTEAEEKSTAKTIETEYQREIGDAHNQVLGNPKVKDEVAYLARKIKEAIDSGDWKTADELNKRRMELLQQGKNMAPQNQAKAMVDNYKSEQAKYEIPEGVKVSELEDEGMDGM